jgi:DNA polymerase III alpha subunit
MLSSHKSTAYVKTTFGDLCSNEDLVRFPSHRRYSCQFPHLVLGQTHSSPAFIARIPPRLGEFIGQIVTTCGLIVEQRTHHQVTGEPMKFLSLADRTGIIETELFAQTYKSYGLATVRYPVLEVEARVEPFENGRGFSLRCLRAGKPRIKT